MLFPPPEAKVTLMFQPIQFLLHVWHKLNASVGTQSRLVHQCNVQMRKESACDS